MPERYISYISVQYISYFVLYGDSHIVYATSCKHLDHADVLNGSSACAVTKMPWSTMQQSYKLVHQWEGCSPPSCASRVKDTCQTSWIQNRDGGRAGREWNRLEVTMEWGMERLGPGVGGVSDAGVHLTPFPGLIHLHRSTPTCVNDIVGTGQNWPLHLLGLILWQGDTYPITLRRPPAVKITMRKVVGPTTVLISPYRNSVRLHLTVIFRNRVGNEQSLILRIAGTFLCHTPLSLIFDHVSKRRRQLLFFAYVSP